VLAFGLINLYTRAAIAQFVVTVLYPASHREGFRHERRTHLPVDISRRGHDPLVLSRDLSMKSTWQHQILAVKRSMQPSYRLQ
jgi:hypothetical protein